MPEPARTQPVPPKRWYLAAGVVVIAVALWLILESLGVGLPPLGRFWPLFVVLGALGFIADFFAGSRTPSSLGRGVGGLGMAVLFFAFSTDAIGWRDFFAWWPALPAIFGASFLASWFAGKMQVQSHLVLGAVGIGLGLTGLAAHYRWFAKIVPSPAILWAILLLVVGIILLRKTFVGRGGGSS
jgi:hypothetical protein